MTQEPEFPKPIRHNGRIYFARSAIEEYKEKLLAKALGRPTKPVHVDVEILVPANQFAKELGFGRRTLGRRIAGGKSEAA